MDKKYRPSNGTEGMSFIESFCDQCIHEKFVHTNNDDDLKCEILSNTMIYDLNDPEYPSEWTYDALDKPCCTKYVFYNWNNDNDDDDRFWTPPKKPDPIPDNQLCFPFALDEILEDHKVYELNCYLLK